MLSSKVHSIYDVCLSQVSAPSVVVVRFSAAGSLRTLYLWREGFDGAYVL